MSNKKISKFVINGVEINVDDKDAIQREGLELHDGDILRYDAEHDTFVPASLDIPETDEELSPSSENPISNKAVSEKFEEVDSAILNLQSLSDKPLFVNYSYDPSTRKITATVIPSQEEGGWIALTDDLNILVISLNTTYNQATETYSVSNIIGDIKIDSNSLTGDIEIPTFEENRIIYFMLLNPVGLNSQLRKSMVNSIVVPGIGGLTRNSISATSSVMLGDQNCIILQAERNLDVDVDVRVTVYSGDSGNKVTSFTRTIQHGSSSVTVNLGSSIYTRRATIQILNIGAGSAYYYELNTNTIDNIQGLASPKYIYLTGHNDSQNNQVWFDAIVKDSSNNAIDVADYENIKIFINITKTPADSSHPFINIAQGYGHEAVTSADSRAADSVGRIQGQNYLADIYFDNSVSDPSDHYVLLGYDIDNNVVGGKVFVPYHEI